MKSIEELRAKTIPLPCSFAGEAGADEVADFPMLGADTDPYTSYKSGFPVKFATDPSTASDGHILRKDMNKVGELATAELHFKEAGMKHKFQADLLNSIVGYPLLCLFGYFDGEYLKHIESQSRDNAVNFTANPLCIDNYVAATVGGEKKVFWKTADKIYGLDEDLFRLEVDYSRVDKLQPTDTLNENSLIVIGDYGYPGEGSVITPSSASLTLTVGGQTIEFDNKGRCGIKIGDVDFKEGAIVIDGKVPYPDEMCGYGNSTVVFYAKKGTAVSYSFSTGESIKQIGVIGEYEVGVAYSLGDVFWHDKNGEKVYYKATRDISAEENTGWDAVVGAISAIGEYEVGVAYSLGDVFWHDKNGEKVYYKATRDISAEENTGWDAVNNIGMKEGTNVFAFPVILKVGKTSGGELQ